MRAYQVGGTIGYKSEWEAAKVANRYRTKYPNRLYRIAFLQLVGKWIVECYRDLEQEV